MTEGKSIHEIEAGDAVRFAKASSQADLTPFAGMQLFGPSALNASWRLDFKLPVFPGDTITAEVEVAEKNEERNRVYFKTRCFKQDGALVAEGRPSWYLKNRRPDRHFYHPTNSLP